jgi:uncharacterized protein RhaS with RHS repeats
MKALATKSYDYGIVLNAVALNAAAGTRTVTLSLNKAWSQVKFTVNYTLSAATLVQCSPSGRTSAGTPATAIAKGALQAYSVAAGVATSNALVLSKTAATSNWIWEVDVNGLVDCDFVFSGTGAPGAGDLITVAAVAMVGI